MATESEMVGARSQCAFCSQLREGLYVCPRCQLNYCSLRCYRNEKHRECSEDFYRRCVEDELKITKYERNSTSQRPQSFEEFMSSFISETDHSINAGTSNEEGEEGEPLDSDDDNMEYLEKVTEATVAELEDADESEVERRLTAMGIGTEPEQLYDALNDSEKAAFAKLAEQMHYAQSGFEDSVFRSKTKHS